MHIYVCMAIFYINPLFFCKVLEILLYMMSGLMDLVPYIDLGSQWLKS